MKLLYIIFSTALIHSQTTIHAAQAQQSEQVAHGWKVLDPELWRTLLDAALSDNVRNIKKIIADKKFDVNATLQENVKMSPLMWAAKMGHDTLAQELIKIPSINLNLQNNRGETALILASKKNGNAAVVKLLLEAGASQDIRDVDSKSYRDYAQQHPSVMRAIQEFENTLACKQVLRKESSELLSGISPLGTIVGEYYFQYPELPQEESEKKTADQ